MQDGMAAKVFGTLLGTGRGIDSGMTEKGGMPGSGMGNAITYRCWRCGDIFDEIEGSPMQCPTCGEKDVRKLSEEGEHERQG